MSVIAKTVILLVLSNLCLCGAVFFMFRR
jgi:hypothetical protein